jgi:hypothetical protein
MHVCYACMMLCMVNACMLCMHASPHAWCYVWSMHDARPLWPKQAFMHTRICTHTQTHTHAHTHTCMHAYIHTHTQAHMHACTHTHIHTYTHTHTHTHMHAYRHAHTHTHTHRHKQTHACIHTYIHTYTHKHARMHTYIHTYIHTNTHRHCTYIHARIHTCIYMHISTYICIALHACLPSSIMMCVSAWLYMYASAAACVQIPPFHACIHTSAQRRYEWIMGAYMRPQLAHSNICHCMYCKLHQCMRANSINACMHGIYTVNGCMYGWIMDA